MDKLSADLRKDHLKAFPILHITYRNQKSFIRFSLLLSGDVELNHGPIKNPCTICQGNVSIRGLFCKSCGIGCHKKCSPIACHTDYICPPYQNVGMPSVDSGNRIDLPFSNRSCLDEQSGRSTDYTLMWQYNSKTSIIGKPSNVRAYTFFTLMLIAFFQKLRKLI